MFDFNSGSQLIFGMLCHYSGRSVAPETFRRPGRGALTIGFVPVCWCAEVSWKLWRGMFSGGESLFPGESSESANFRYFGLISAINLEGVHHFYLSVPEAGLGVGHHTALFSPGDGHIQESPLLPRCRRAMTWPWRMGTAPLPHRQYRHV